MTAAELAALASQCYGQRWQSALARDMNINVRTVQRWAADGIDKPATASNVRRFLTERRVVSIPTPDPTLSEEERDDACYNAMEPPLAALTSAADDQGWHPAEIWVAVLAIACDRLYAMGGRSAAVETVEQAINDLKQRPEKS
jgi:hypothetical protein